MAYRFKHRETVLENVKRIALEQLDSAIDNKRGASREDWVHTVPIVEVVEAKLAAATRRDVSDLFTLMPVDDRLLL